MICLKKKDGSISFWKVFSLAFMVSIVFTIIGNVIGSLFENKEKIRENTDNEKE